MNYDPKTDDALLQGLLYRADAASTTTDDTDEDELFALFAEGRLQGEDRDAFLQYLDTHPTARAAAGASLRHIQTDPDLCAEPCAPERSMPHPRRWLDAVLDKVREALTPRRQPAFAMAAATVLVALTAYVWFAGQHAGNPTVAMNGANGWRLSPPQVSDRTGTSDSASRKGELLKLIESMLSRVDDPAERKTLKDGYRQLITDRKQAPEVANAFDSLTTRKQDSFHAWLALSNAAILKKDFARAKTAAEKALEIKRGSLDAQINLAIALSDLALAEKNGAVREQLFDEAVSELQAIENRTDKAADEYRERVQQEIEYLNEQRHKQ